MTGRVERSVHKTGWNYVEEAKFIVTVKGGQPKPDIYEWTLPYGQKITPGQRSGNYYAKPPTVSIPQITGCNSFNRALPMEHFFGLLTTI